MEVISYSNEHKLDMILIYGECHRNARASKRLYVQRYPGRPAPSDKLFTKLANNLKEIGSFSKKRTVFGPRIARNEDHAADVMGRVIVDPNISIRQIAQETDISYTSIQRILKENKFHAYKIHLHQSLLPGDYERRLIFTAWIDTAREDGILNNIMWSDESRFHNNGTVNRHNCHYWSQENPHWIRETNFQYIWGINVWCGILNGQIIGPKFYEGTLNSQRYLQFIREELGEYLENVPLETRREMYFQQDGAPPHNAGIVSNYLQLTFPGRWIANNGAVRWPARSPDLTPLDYFLWGYLKDKVYVRPLVDVEDLKTRIRDECRNISEETLRNVTTRELLHRAECCLEANGGHFEHLI